MLQYKTLIFDLGNVLVSFNQKKIMQKLARLCHLPLSAIEQIIFEEGIGMQYEKGLLSSQQVYRLFCERAHKQLEFAHFAKAASDTLIPRKKMIDLLYKLKEKKYRLLLLSNTSEAHITFLQTRYSFLDIFDGMTLSYIVKAIKPERAIYEHSLSLAKCSPVQCFYVDDLVENIKAGEECGMKGHLFRSYPLLMKTLNTLGILPA